ncbi:uncharacterized protein [Miscanthus floridulus]|uniref:uncharacterized protein isoform X3 n=1 Tax=Miscanthus floridulus TaxID=154761 RepID=UPI0034586ED2
MQFFSLNLLMFVHFFYEIVFLEEFQTFDDKSSAINVDTGVNSQLNEMIMKYYRPGHTLVVGNEEYKSIIESSLEIPCLYDGIVMELMWGMQHLMHRLVPGEKSELPKEDRVPMSQGLQMFLSGYGYHVKPEMIFFTQDVKLKLLKDADKYKGKVNEAACLMAYKTLVSAHKRKIQDRIELSTLVFEARRAHEGPN